MIIRSRGGGLRIAARRGGDVAAGCARAENDGRMVIHIRTTKDADYRHRRLLRARRERPRGCRAAQQRNERAAPSC
jgi:hypothetical protein